MVTRTRLEPPYLLRDFCEHCEPQVMAIVDWVIARQRFHAEPPTITPEQTLREAGISTRRQARYQRRMSSLLAGRS